MTSFFNALRSWWAGAAAAVPAPSSARVPAANAAAQAAAAQAGAASVAHDEQPMLPSPPAFEVPTLKLSGTAYTHTGPVRPANEDAVRCLLHEAGAALGERVSLLVVADGMGGHQAGEVASLTVVDTLCELWHRRPGQTRGAPHPAQPGDAPHPAQPGGAPTPVQPGAAPAAANPWAGAAPQALDMSAELARAIRHAHAQVFAKASAQPAWQGMGSTVVALAIHGDWAVVGHVGDSRAYRLRQGQLQALTQDDSFVNHLLRTGAITEAQVQAHPERGVLTQALGTRAEPPNVHVSAPMAIEAGDLFMLCSDGVHEVLSPAVLAQQLSKGLAQVESGAMSLALLAQALAQAATAAGTRDNLSVALLYAQAVPEPAQATGPASLAATRVHQSLRPTCLDNPATTVEPAP